MKKKRSEMNKGQDIVFLKTTRYSPESRRNYPTGSEIDTQSSSESVRSFLEEAALGCSSLHRNSAALTTTIREEITCEEQRTMSGK